MLMRGAAVYSATKAAVKTFSDGLRIDTIATDIKVTTIQPGIVETDFSQVRFHGDKDKAAKVYQGLEASSPRYCGGGPICHQATTTCSDFRYDHHG